MVRAWLKRLGNKWFSEAPKARCARRGGVRLAVEALEERAVPALGLVTVTTDNTVFFPTVKAGSTLPISLQAQYLNGSGYTGVVNLDVTDAQGNVLSTAQYTMRNGNEVSSSGDVVTTAGTDRVVLDPSDGASAAFGGAYATHPLKVLVTPLEVASVTFTRGDGTPLPGTVTVGDATEVQITAYDRYGNFASGANRAVNLSTSAPAGLAIVDANNTPITSATVTNGIGYFYVNALHSTAYLNATSFTLSGSGINATGQIFLSNVVQFTVNPSLYNFQFTMAYFNNGIYTNPMTISGGPVSDPAQAEATGLLYYQAVMGNPGTIEPGAIITAAN
jgi:hypothetical protein